MNDLTILYYTDNNLNESVREKIANYLLAVTGNQYPVISVSQKPIKLGQNICVGPIGKSKYNMYKQVLVGAEQVQTKYLACVDDDTLYSPEHFLYRPPNDTFSYETNYWFAQPYKDYFWRVHDVNTRGGMWGCITNTRLLVSNLQKRFELYPTQASQEADRNILWGEPGIFGRRYDVGTKFIRHWCEKPCVIFIHEASMGYTQFRRYYRRYGLPLPEDKTDRVEPFGQIKDIFLTYFGNTDGAR